MAVTRNPETSSSWRAKLFQLAPGLPALWPYDRSNFPHDLIAGLSVAAVALPVGVAYAQLAGFNPSVGLYSSILPLVAYALFGTSRQLIIGPDAATCALIATAVTPLAKGNPQDYESLSVTLCFLAGVLCIGASFLRLGAMADFLSKPILVGFLNGIALSVILGQIGKIFGFAIDRGRIVPRLVEFIAKLGQTHWPTLAIGLGTFVVLLVTPKLLKRVPAALVAIVLSALVVRFLGLEHLGVKIVGDVPAGLPHLHIPTFSLELIPPLLGDAAGLALVTFSSMMLTSRSFAARNRYDVDADREFAALGMANIASAFSQGFAVSGADSRTAMNDASGGRTQVTGLVAAGTIAVVLLFLYRPAAFCAGCCAWRGPGEGGILTDRLEGTQTDLQNRPPRIRALDSRDPRRCSDWRDSSHSICSYPRDSSFRASRGTAQNRTPGESGGHARLSLA